jgi:short-subunit dehydrogenase
MMELAQKYGPWALITGASEGTGAAFAHQLADAGLNLVLIARREGPLAALAGEIRGKGGECITATVDLSTLDAGAKIAAAAGGEIGLFIANAGADTVNSMFLDQDVSKWDELINLNVVTTMRNTHFFGRAMRERGRGGIILVGSGACYGGLNGLAIYTGVKAFDLCFGEALWAELRHSNVDVLSLILGRTDTPAHRRSLEAGSKIGPEGGAFHGKGQGLCPWWGMGRSPHHLLGLLTCRPRPKARMPSGTFSVIAEPAATKALSPTETGATSTALEPMKAFAPITVRCFFLPS